MLLLLLILGTRAVSANDVLSSYCKKTLGEICIVLVILDAMIYHMVSFQLGRCNIALADPGEYASRLAESS